MVITFNYKEGTTTITFDDLKTALANQKTGSDLDCSTAPIEIIRTYFREELRSDDFFPCRQTPYFPIT
jgi:hypothetical protein